MTSAKSYASLAILCVINLLNYMDRFTVAGVLSEIETYFGLNDTGAGLLQTAFIISYMFMAPVFGYLGDRYPRKMILLCGVLFWSITTFIGSLVPKDVWFVFFVMRALVGVGEASYSTIAPTIIADLFPRGARTRMLALFYFAIPVGSGLGYIIGSSIAEQLGSWRWALRFTPPLGLLTVILMFFFLDEPQRGSADGAVTQEKSSISNDLKYLLNVRSYLWSTAGFTCVCFAIGALSWWAPTYMALALKVEANDTTYIDKDDIRKASLVFGIITCIAGIVGVLMGSGGAQWYRKYNPRADPLVCAFGVLGGVPFVFLGLVLAHISSNSAWFLIFIGITLLCTNWALVADILLSIIVPNRRSMAQAIQILTSHILGDASSPAIVGALDDAFTGGQNAIHIKYSSLQYSLYINSFILVFGGIAFFYASKYIVSDQELCKSQSHGQRDRNSSETSIHTLPPGLSINASLEDSNDLIAGNTIIDADSNNLIENQY